MTVEDVFCEITDDVRRLNDVFYLCDPELTGQVVGLELRFDDDTTTIRVDADHDELLIFVGRSSDPSLFRRPAVDKEPWSRAVGRAPFWIWELHNQQGYRDGLQFFFLLGDSDATIQIVAEASFLTVSEVSRIVVP